MPRHSIIFADNIIISGSNDHGENGHEDPKFNYLTFKAHLLMIVNQLACVDILLSQTLKDSIQVLL
jgi:hypothetical protein